MFSTFGILTVPTVHAQSAGLPSGVAQRVVEAKAYQADRWILPNETPITLGNALASLHPTYVSDLIRVNGQIPLSAQEVTDYNTIRSIVLAKNPDAKFDVVLNPYNYNTTTEILTAMKTINSKLKIDIWFFDDYAPAYKANPVPLDAAISYAHSLGQYIGGNVWGTSVPPGSDFVAVSSIASFGYSAWEVSKLELKYDIPVLAHIENNPQHGMTDASCVFIYNLTSAQRATVITDQAANQTIGRYVNMYPAFFPNCPTNLGYDSLRDGTVFSTIKSLMNQYNPINNP